MFKSKTKCNSFVFLDLETTGLPYREADGGKTKITEISMICVAREILSKVHDDLPRNLSKLLFTVNPRKLISNEISRITGLDNFMLENEDPLDEKKVASIKSFLEQLKQPICLVAHNGNRFDFPILKEELLKFSNIIPEDTCCCDTFVAFRDLCNRPDIDENYLTYNPLITNIDREIIRETDRVVAKQETNLNMNKSNTHFMQLLNEVTPPSQKISNIPNPLNIPLSCRKRKLFDDENNEGDTRVPESNSFALHNVYYRIFGHPPSHCHRAEDDTETMLKCTLKFGQPILDWFDLNSIPYSAIKPVYTRNKVTDV